MQYEALGILFCNWLKNQNSNPDAIWISDYINTAQSMNLSASRTQHPLY